MTDDRIAGTAKNLGGKVQEGYGSVTGDLGHEVKGRMRQAEGAAQGILDGQAKDVLSDAASAAKDGGRGARYRPRDHRRTAHTVAIAALAVGFVIGRMGRSD